VQIDLCGRRERREVWLPPRTFGGDRGGPGGVLVVGPAGRIAAARGGRVIAVDHATRLAARDQARSLQRAAVEQRRETERAGGGAPGRPRTASLAVPSAHAVAPHGGLSTTTTATKTQTTTTTGPGGQKTTTTTTATKTTTTAPGQHPPGAPLPHPGVQPAPNRQLPANHDQKKDKDQH
jgi:hypothetical protein